MANSKHDESGTEAREGREEGGRQRVAGLHYRARDMTIGRVCWRIAAFLQIDAKGNSSCFDVHLPVWLWLFF